MGPGTIIDIALYAGCGTCALQAVAAYARLARTKDGHRDAGSWHPPLIFTSATFALLGAVGALPPLIAALFAAVPLLVVTRIVWRAWRLSARKLGWATATAIVLGGLLSRVREAAGHTREDLRDLVVTLRPGTVADAPAAPAAGIPPLAALRSVPSVREPGSIGSVPAPAEVAAGLEAAGVEVPPPFRAVAEWIAGFEPEDQQDLTDHMAQEAAGMLAVAGAKEAQAETLLNVPKLHPDYVAGQLEVADQIAEVAASAAMADRRYHEVYGDIEDWHADGNELPEDARNWGFGGAA